MKKTISSFDLSCILGMEIDVLENMLDGNSLYTEDDVYSLDLPADAKQRLDLYFDSQPKVKGKQRKDIQGFFYDLQPKTVTVKPEPVWKRDDYLPDLEYCLNYKYDEFTDRELVDCKEKLAFDIEVFGNYTLIAFKGVVSGKQCFIELSENHTPNYHKLAYLMDNKEFVSFKGIKFDLPIMTLFLAGKTTAELWRATEMLINEEMRPYEVLKHFGVTYREIDQIDLIEVAKGKASLKLYAARLGLKNIQDLPFLPGSILNSDRIAIVKRYCINDLDATIMLYDYLKPAIDLRIAIGKTNGLDIRSRSDAQCAEDCIKYEIEKLTNRKIPRIANMASDKISLSYNIPDFISFKTDRLITLLSQVKTAKITVVNGKLFSDLLKNTVLKFGNIEVAMGTGGLHSRESRCSWYTSDDFELIDSDADSFYPFVITKQKLYPDLLGTDFIDVYKSIIDRRIIAKKAGDKVTDGALKIQINGGFGKFGSQYSSLYAPQLLIQTTITGQLALLMLIERFSLLEIPIAQINTDGVVCYVHKSKKEQYLETVAQWQIETGYNMSYTYYKSLHSRDVNSYFAVKSTGGVKRKGAFAEFEIDKNTANIVCSEAVARYLEFGESMEEYIHSCKDIKKFLTPRKVDGGAVKDGKFIGKTVRFYHSNSTNTSLVYAKSGNKVPDSDRCRPMQRLAKEIPSDLDYSWYISNCYSILRDVGVKI